MEKRDSLASALFVITALLVMGIGLMTRGSLLISKELGKVLGEVIFIFGMVLFAWVVAYLRGAFFGNVAPVTKQLVKNGPYRWVRHPLYLSMMIVLLGIVIGLRSLWGIVGVFVLFLPAVIYRAKLEEQALAAKFGKEWYKHDVKTYFLIPPW